MNQEGWIFMTGIWTILIGFVIWSYRALLSEPHIPTGYYEVNHHPGASELPNIDLPDNSDNLVAGSVRPVTDDEEISGV
jgi:hypothetical protein